MPQRWESWLYLQHLAEQLPQNQTSKHFSPEGFRWNNSRPESCRIVHTQGSRINKPSAVPVLNEASACRVSSRQAAVTRKSRLSHCIRNGLIGDKHNASCTSSFILSVVAAAQKPRGFHALFRNYSTSSSASKLEKTISAQRLTPEWVSRRYKSRSKFLCKLQHALTRLLTITSPLHTSNPFALFPFTQFVHPHLETGTIFPPHTPKKTCFHSTTSPCNHDGLANNPPSYSAPS